MKRTDINIRDPFVLVHEGAYYLYGTRGATCWGPADGFDVYVSHDLENWDGPHVCFHNDGSFWADRNYWAPEVYHYRPSLGIKPSAGYTCSLQAMSGVSQAEPDLNDGAFYMFASFKKNGVKRGTAVLKADSPMGPFRPHSDGCVTPRDWECLDGTLYVSKSGVPYMVFCHEWVQVGDGEVCAIQLTPDLSAPVGEPMLLFHASDAPWCKVIHHSSGMDGWVTDGPYFWRTADGTLLCLWASFSEGGYTEGVAVSDNGEIDGNFTQVEPLFMDDGGHGMVFRALDGQLYLTLHSPNTKLEERPFFHPIVEVGNRLVRK